MKVKFVPKTGKRFLKDIERCTFDSYINCVLWIMSTTLHRSIFCNFKFIFPAKFRCQTIENENTF